MILAFFTLFFEVKSAIIETLTAEQYMTPPLSVPVDELIKTGIYECTTDTCPNNEISDECGKRCLSTNGNVRYEYTFKGEKFQIFGTYDSKYRAYDVLLDGKLLATVNQSASRKEYQLQFSSNIFEYGQHTIRIQGRREGPVEINRIAYWPSVDAIRLNISEILPQWTVESDGTGGLREYTTPQSNSKTINLHATKIWVIGSSGPSYSKCELLFNGQKYLSTSTTTVNNAIIIETPHIDTHDDFIRLQKENSSEKPVKINCIYYLSLPPEVVTTAPVLVSTSQMTISGSYNANYYCKTDSQCPRENATGEPCGERCWTMPPHTASFTYTFKGEKFQIYGTKDPNYGHYRVYLNDIQIAHVNQYQSHRVENSLQFDSHVFAYGTHTVKIEGENDKPVEFNRIGYWPSVRAIRLNATETDGGSWYTESDGAGGLRIFNVGYTSVEIRLICDKLWVYGSGQYFHMSSSASAINKQTYSDNPENALMYEVTTNTREEVIYKIGLPSYGPQTIRFNCIFYLPEKDIEPETIPFSIPIRVMKRAGGSAQCDPGVCAPPLTSPCGDRCRTNGGNNDLSFEAVFKGEKFQVFGKFDPSHGEYAIYLDDKFITKINQAAPGTIEYDVLQYTSFNFQYGFHRVRVQGIGNIYEFYKFTFWPSVKAKRKNITEFAIYNFFDEIVFTGGTRWYTYHGGDGSVNTTIDAGKFWVYGTKCECHGYCKVSFGNDFEEGFSEYSLVDYETGFWRSDNVLAYESPTIPFKFNTQLSLTNPGPLAALFDCIFYLDTQPPPTPTISKSPSPSPSMSPTASNSKLFTKSDSFSKSSQFSKSFDFSNSNEFTKSFYFSNSNEFTKSKFFSESNDFTKSFYFSNSNEFTESNGFSESNDFTKSKYFSNSNEFTKSKVFSESNDFPKSNPFTKSDEFTQTIPFTKSNIYTKSNPFTISNTLRESSVLIEIDVNKKSSSNHPEAYSKSSIFSASNFNQFLSTQISSSRTTFFTQSSSFSTSKTLSLFNSEITLQSYLHNMETNSIESDIFFSRFDSLTDLSNNFLSFSSGHFYESSPFEKNVIDPGNTDTDTHKKGGLKSFIIVGVVCAVFALAILIICIVLYKKRKRNDEENQTEEMKPIEFASEIKEDHSSNNNSTNISKDELDDDLKFWL